MSSIDAFAQTTLADLAAKSLRRTLVATARGEAAGVVRGSKTRVSFSCNDYLGLSHDPRVIAAGRAALERYGAGAGASRLVTGNHPPLLALEPRLAAHEVTAAASPPPGRQGGGTRRRSVGFRMGDRSSPSASACRAREPYPAPLPWAGVSRCVS